tara:strand:- start:157 stop:360 length:204 start_codon:yes stop_codon:yes gene_type:complete
MTKKELIKSIGLRRYGLVDYIKELETTGMDTKAIKVSLLQDEIVKSERVLYDEWRFYQKIKPQVSWR